MKSQRLSERCRIETAAKMTANMQADSECVLALSKLIITFTLRDRAQFRIAPEDHPDGRRLGLIESDRQALALA
jgi:hypothetical protein